MLQLDTAWRIKAQKEQLAQLACKVRAGQEEQDTTEAQLLQKERSAAKQVCEVPLSHCPVRQLSDAVSVFVSEAVGMLAVIYVSLTHNAFHFQGTSVLASKLKLQLLSCCQV